MADIADLLQRAPRQREPPCVPDGDPRLERRQPGGAARSPARGIAPRNSGRTRRAEGRGHWQCGRRECQHHIARHQSQTFEVNQAATHRSSTLAAALPADGFLRLKDDSTLPVLLAPGASHHQEPGEPLAAGHERLRGSERRLMHPSMPSQQPPTRSPAPRTPSSRWARRCRGGGGYGWLSQLLEHSWTAATTACCAPAARPLVEPAEPWPSPSGALRQVLEYVGVTGNANLSVPVGGDLVLFQTPFQQ